MSSPDESRDDGGYTLVELLVVILLAAVIGTITTTVIVTAFRQQSRTDGRAAALVQVRQALQRTMREIRAADPLWALSTSTLVLKESTSTGTVRTLTYSVTTTNGVTSLVETESDVDAAGHAVAGPGPRTVVSHLVNAAAQPVFSVVAPMPGYAGSASVDPATCVIAGQTPTTYERDCVGVLQLHLVVLPTNVQSGASLCPANLANPATCYLDISDSADLRNVS
jgi:prepilin-type N-terminal cleavage/methylation domain-containing protein